MKIHIGISLAKFKKNKTAQEQKKTKVKMNEQ